MPKIRQKITLLNDLFHVPELPKHIPDGNSFNPPRCMRCKTIFYWDTENNICQECFNSDVNIQDIKDEYQLKIDDLISNVEDLDGTLDELSSLKSKYLWKNTPNEEKSKIIQKLLDLIPN